jgi:hypothetical protein
MRRSLATKRKYRGKSLSAFLVVVFAKDFEHRSKGREFRVCLRYRAAFAASSLPDLRKASASAQA